MRRIVVMCLAALLSFETCWAQTEPPAALRKPSIPMAAVSEGKKLTGKSRIRYLLRQLDLTPEQRKTARGLIASILDQADNQPFTIEQVTTLMAEAQQADADGDEERKKQVEQQLRNLAKGYDREDEFFMNMEPDLTAEQKTKLKAARERLNRNPSGALRPIDVFRLLPKLDPTTEQQEKFKQILKDFRASLRESKSLPDEKRFQLMNGLLEYIRRNLTPQQRATFELSINRLRPDLLAHGLRARVPTTQPAERMRKTLQEEEPNGN